MLRCSLMLEYLTKDICLPHFFKTRREVFIASPRFPDNYPSDTECSCAVVLQSLEHNALLHVELLLVSVRHDVPCTDWLQLGRRRVCGTRGGWYQSRQALVTFHSDSGQGHRGFWLRVSGETTKQYSCIEDVLVVQKFSASLHYTFMKNYMKIHFCCSATAKPALARQMRQRLGFVSPARTPKTPTPHNPTRKHCHSDTFKRVARARGRE